MNGKIERAGLRTTKLLHPYLFCNCPHADFLLVRTMNELYRYLSIDIVNGEDAATPVSNGKPSVTTSLSHFFQPDLREVKCEKCSKGAHATESLFVSERYVVRAGRLLQYLKSVISSTILVVTGRNISFCI
jgi:hypothetical protein